MASVFVSMVISGALLVVQMLKASPGTVCVIETDDVSTLR